MRPSRLTYVKESKAFSTIRHDPTMTPVTGGNLTKDQKEAKKYAPDHTPVGSTFFLKRIPQQANRPYCHNDHSQPTHHVGKQSQGLTRKKVASFELLILGYPTFLCPKCAIEWQRIWKSALSSDRSQA